MSPSESAPRSSHQQPAQTNQIAFCWGGQRVFVTTGEGTTRILSYPDFEPVFRLNHPATDEKPEEFVLTGHTSSCVAAELQPTGRYLATGGTDSVIALWDTTDWICQRAITRIVGPIRNLSESFAADSASRQICVHPNMSGRNKKKKLANQGLFSPQLPDLGFTFDGSYVVGGSDEGKLSSRISSLFSPSPVAIRQERQAG